MKNLKLLAIALSAGSLLTGCSNNADPSAKSTVSLTMSATTANGKTMMGGRVASTVTLTDVKVNVREIEFEFDHEDDHFKKDSSFMEDNESKLKGPYIVDLLNSGAFVDQVITSIDVPNAKYEKVSFKLAPGTEAGDMNGKSILIKGSISDKPFEFWHNRRSKFGAKFSDSTALATNGAAVTLAIKLEMDKILSAANGGVDLSLAKDGNNDGTISIDPTNVDGNKELADVIMSLLVRHTHCEKGKH